MILIYNNEQHKLILNESYWEKEDWEYVIARKLIVESKDSKVFFSNPNNLKYIYLNTLISYYL